MLSYRTLFQFIGSVVNADGSILFAATVDKATLYTENMIAEAVTHVQMT